jgi:hypothetical protein
MITEKEYRALERDSYSSLKDFIENRQKYYRKWILKEEVVEDLSDSLKMGSLTDTLLFEPGEFDNRFVMTTAQSPTGQMLEFTKALYRRSIECRGEDGTLGRTFEVLTKDAYNDVKFDRAGNIVAFKRKGDSLEGVIEKFTESEAELYYRQLMASYGKIAVELYQVQGAERLVATLKSNWVTKEVINQETDKRYEVHNQLIIIFEHKGYQLKAMLDKVIVDHNLKKIFIWDLKTCWDNEREFETNWYKYKYYIQAAVYYLAVLHWAQKEGWGDYQIEFMKFVVVDSSNYQNPLIYETDAVNLQQGLEGFVMKGRYYPGVNRAIQDLAWCRENQIWEISRTNYEAKGIVKIKPFIEDEY